MSERFSFGGSPLTFNDLVKLGGIVVGIVVATYTVMHALFPAQLAKEQVKSIADSNLAAQETQSGAFHQEQIVKDLQNDVAALKCADVALRARLDAERSFLPTTKWADREEIRKDAAKNALSAAKCEWLNGSR